jgi:hypothetical protein
MSTNGPQLYPTNVTWAPKSTRIQAGMVQRKIRPPLGVRTGNWGAARSQISDGFHNEITTTVLALRPEGGLPHFLISVDWGWWQSRVDDLAIRGEVIKALQVDEDRLLFHLTHTHAGPTTASDAGSLPGGENLDKYHKAATQEFISACKEAIDISELADINWSYGSCDLATNRDLPCLGEDILGFNPEESADDTLVVGRITNRDGRVLGTVVNYACHPTTLAWENQKISPDFVGEARDIVQRHTSAPMLFLQGASGDLGPRDGFSGDTEVADKNGRVLGYAVLSTLENMPQAGVKYRFDKTVDSGALLGVWKSEPIAYSSTSTADRIDVQVPLQKLPTFEELKERWKDVEEGARQTRIDRAMKLRSGYVTGDKATHPVWMWIFGDAIIVGQPGEMYSKYQMELRARHPERIILVLNCTNGPGYMYFPSPEAYERLRYQSWQTLVAAGALEEVLEATDLLIANRLKV